ncbi:uncharacterized protein LOC116337162 [Contarinia nasturtii]|uniref:uncharacterized protein LOC116337162 n=1 Tax=Contarinia nasturtii TaxID=265458 RepID=UPI0012D3A4EB|nr:uncharacterized protein LOC116337162 [Contarinia nasturtii]
MGFLVVKNCCCCFDLKSGTIFYAALTILMHLILFALLVVFETVWALPFLLPIPLFVMVIYGVVKEKPGFIIPSLVLTTIYIALPIIYFFISNVFDNMKTSQRTQHRNLFNMLEFILSFIFLCCLVLVVLAVYYTYFWIIQFSAYKLIRNEKRAVQNGIV